MSFNQNHYPILGGRYLLIDSLGEGGNAKVYRSFDLQDQKTIAVKVMNLTGAAQKAEAEKESNIMDEKRMRRQEEPTLMSPLPDEPCPMWSHPAHEPPPM